MLIYPSYITIYLYRPILFKVFHPVLPYRPSKHNLQTEPPVMHQCVSLSLPLLKGAMKKNNHTQTHNHNINYERFNRNSFNIHSWSWNYRGCWHQTCPPIATLSCLCLAFIPIAPSAKCQENISICRHYLALSALSNLRACCLPWKW